MRNVNSDCIPAYPPPTTLRGLLGFEEHRTHIGRSNILVVLGDGDVERYPNIRVASLNDDARDAVASFDSSLKDSLPDSTIPNPVPDSSWGTPHDANTVMSAPGSAFGHGVARRVMGPWRLDFVLRLRLGRGGSLSINTRCKLRSIRLVAFLPSSLQPPPPSATLLQVSLEPLIPVSSSLLFPSSPTVRYTTITQYIN
ncbi:hypothetical protein M422DRAFT_276835 [Sphaerobolus stellatus SS14]|uniref:Uncharacterized protein n=1 Tax=Sphaerobolus stellatus (strain SS14) TaxID=990650 RepID=A0A0C9U114_SPHS4|nr:hypothetical protein M422DRAFT_276835 [Sphaerobolus stellatus SS14]